MANLQQGSGAIPAWTWATPVAVFILLAAKTIWHLTPSGPVLGLAVLLLGASVFAAVHHAEIAALKSGEPFGSLILAIAVTVIEVALIISFMLSAKAGNDTLARDTVYTTVMIVLNGIVGLCLIIGGARHREQIFQTNAAAATLSVLATLAFIALVLPNYTRALPGPVYERSQLIFAGTVSAALYFIFLFVQTIRHRDYFLSAASTHDKTPHELPSGKITAISIALLAACLCGVVLLAKFMSPALEDTVTNLGLPNAFTGVIIAAVVLLPEAISAITAARSNKLQTSLNLALGSAMATIGLTIPMVSFAALSLGQNLTLGLQAEEMSLLLLTLFISTVTLATGRTTILQGCVHFVIFSVFLFLSAVP